MSFPPVLSGRSCCSLPLLLLYWLAPDIEKSIRWVLPGTALATLAISILFAAMDLILSYSNPGAAYGAAGSVLILLWSLFLLSAIVIVEGSSTLSSGAATITS